ncbi:hypothetical protein EYF80_059599 [Liparis tanakae]|uniref:Uncharacterized protein n=1 Tax=Liparis tanakae TaxID=230148 RepID=A0A4Z2ENB9_9TELE|nr:hypothetical protein EYF80_059599 [Liparis tanakae]
MYSAERRALAQADAFLCLGRSQRDVKRDSGALWNRHPTHRNMINPSRGLVLSVQTLIKYDGSGTAACLREAAAVGEGSDVSGGSEEGRGPGSPPPHFTENMFNLTGVNRQEEERKLEGRDGRQRCFCRSQGDFVPASQEVYPSDTTGLGQYNRRACERLPDQPCPVRAGR